MNNKGLYTSAIGILVLLLITANLYVFLGAKENAGSSAISSSVRDVQKAWYKTSFVIDAAHNAALYKYLKNGHCEDAILGVDYANVETTHINYVLGEMNFSGNLQCMIMLCSSQTCNTTLKCVKYAQNPDGSNYEQIVYEKPFRVDKRFNSIIDPTNPANCLIEIKDWKAKEMPGNRDWCLIDEIAPLTECKTWASSGSYP